MSNSAEISGSEGISGYELARRVLDHPQGGVAALIELAAGGETEWLEFKAAMVGLPEDRKNPRENDADGYWNVAEAVLAMANSRGGAVLVGVRDSGQAIGLAAGDPRKIIESHGAEAYRRREILDRIRPPPGTLPVGDRRKRNMGTRASVAARSFLNSGRYLSRQGHCRHSCPPFVSRRILPDRKTEWR